MLQERIWGTCEAFIEGGEILGRKVANQTFLAAFLEKDLFDSYHFFLNQSQTKKDLEIWLKENFLSLYEESKIKIFDLAILPHKISENQYFSFHISDCLERQVSLQRIRNVYSRHIFPITGVSHSLSYARFMPQYFSHLWEGSTKRDSIIATSQCAEDALRNVFSGLINSYSMDLKVPRIDKIPLGIMDKSLASDELIKKFQAEIRQHLGLGDAEKLPLIYLCFGRIAAQSKMDLLPLLSAFKRAQDIGLHKEDYLLILSGSVGDNDPFIDSLKSLAAFLQIPMLLIPTPGNAERDSLYELADVFIAPSDNLQETFGLTVIEAQRAGLPVLASDFNGYKDTVRHGESGFLIPTIGFSGSYEADVLSCLWFENQYHFSLAQGTAIDLKAFAKAIVELAENHELRRKMGAKGRLNFEKNYRWSAVLDSYYGLWQELNDLPLSEDELRSLRKPHPLSMNFAGYFKGHFAQTISSPELTNRKLIRTHLGSAMYQGVIKEFPYVGLELFLKVELLHRVLFLCRKEISLEDLIKSFRAEFIKAKVEQEGNLEEERVQSHVLWLLKHDFIEFL